MGRKEERIKNRLEKNPIKECNKVQSKYCPKLLGRFAETKDPRHQSYVNYSNKIMLGTMYYKGIGGITSMNDMTRKFNKPFAVDNIREFLGEKESEYLPHGVTINDYFKRLNPEELQGIIQEECYDLIRRKSFDEARFKKKWLVVVDGTQLYSGNRQINEKCLQRRYNKETENEIVNYHSDVLEAKIVFGEKIITSIGSEFIENNGEDAERQKNMNEKQRKQDSELKAFKRLAQKLKKAFPRLPIILLVDSLYASETFFSICEKNNWEYIIRYKAGSIPSIAKEYEAIPEKETVGHAEYVNEIDYNVRTVNMLKYWEEKIVKGKVVRTNFQWLTSLNISQKNAEKIAEIGRVRWKIENEGFNRQKNWQGDITHACSWNDQAMKNHYLMMQISDMIKQLYEWYYLKKNEIVKTHKDISSDLLASFAGQPTWEDILVRDTHSVSNN